MSRELDYFPPQGTKYKWWNKPLQHLPWGASIWEHWPADIVAHVSKKNGVFIWWVDVCTFNFERKCFKGTAKKALTACLAAEKRADKEKAKIWMPWMNDAVAAGWRPPCVKRQY